MKVMMGPIASYCHMTGNKGLTGVVVIETSHIALHTWDEDNPAMLQLDVYSCSKVDLNVVWKAIEVFEPTHIDYKFLDRKDKYITIL
jgi:S-adenosylmethionine/arginine decarboxylase-like enzyme